MLANNLILYVHQALGFSSLSEEGGLLVQIPVLMYTYWSVLEQDTEPQTACNVQYAYDETRLHSYILGSAGYSGVQSLELNAKTSSATEL